MRAGRTAMLNLTNPMHAQLTFVPGAGIFGEEPPKEGREQTDGPYIKQQPSEQERLFCPVPRN